MCIRDSKKYIVITAMKTMKFVLNSVVKYMIQLK